MSEDVVYLDDPRNVPDPTFNAEEAESRLKELLYRQHRIEQLVAAAQELGGDFEDGYGLDFSQELATLRSRLSYGPFPKIARPKNWLFYQQLERRIDANVSSLAETIARDLVREKAL